MSDIVIKADGLGKRYTIGHQRIKSGQTFREALIRNARDLGHKTLDLLRGRPLIPGDTHEDVWALRGIEFEIRRGEAVGIMGRNGAGKSTLLKILSRITDPTEGRVMIKGRVASLLEVGTGFHSELTGRENIFLNGTILGMTRAEIKKKFDEIVAFAEVEKFLDTPVKRYSSGMYVRLAFAVAAHRDPDILLVDEVLAVGDAHFYNKCTNKMGETIKRGTTIFLVSHNMWLIQTICNRAMFLDHGRIVKMGDPLNTVQEYLNAQSQAPEEGRGEDEKKPVSMRYAETRDMNGNPMKETTPDGTVVVFATYVCLEKRFWGYFYLRVTTPDGYPLYTAYSGMQELPEGPGNVEAIITSFSLLEGEYRIWIGVCGMGKEKERISEKQLKIEIKSSPAFPEPRFGIFFNKVVWKKTDLS